MKYVLEEGRDFIIRQAFAAFDERQRCAFRDVIRHTSR